MAWLLLLGVAEAQPAKEHATTSQPLSSTLQVAATRSQARDVAPDYRIDADGRGANPRHGLRLTFTADGARVAGRDGAFSLRLVRFGRGDGEMVRQTTPRIDGAWVEYDRGAGLGEWFVNLPQGVEQGWTVTDRPVGSGPIVLALGTERPPDLVEEDRLVWSGLVYHSLMARDANGRTLPSRWVYDDARLRIEVDDSNAAYPILIDPWVQQAKLTSSDGDADDAFGWGVAITGETAVVGRAVPSRRTVTQARRTYTSAAARPGPKRRSFCLPTPPTPPLVSRFPFGPRPSLSEPEAIQRTSSSGTLGSGPSKPSSRRPTAWPVMRSVT